MLEVVETADEALLETFAATAKDELEAVAAAEAVLLADAKAVLETFAAVAKAVLEEAAAAEALLETAAGWAEMMLLLLETFRLLPFQCTSRVNFEPILHYLLWVSL